MTTHTRRRSWDAVNRERERMERIGPPCVLCDTHFRAQDGWDRVCEPCRVGFFGWAPREKQAGASDRR